MHVSTGIDRWLVRIALAILIVSVVAGVVLLWRIWPPPPPTFGFTGFTVFIAIIFGGMGALILGLRPGNAIGWLLLIEGVASAVQFAFDTAPAGAAAGPAADQGAVVWLSAFSNVIWIWSVAVFGPLFLLFPDGKPISPRWGLLAPLSSAGAVMVVIGFGTMPGPLFNFPEVLNPITIGGDWSGAMVAVGAALFVGGSALSALSLVIRWRRSDRDSRAQLKWLAAVSLPFVVAGIASPGLLLAQYLMIGFAMLIPVAIAIAVLRYRLYDIDQVISRTFVYGALTAILAGIYAATLKLMQVGFVQVTGKESDGAVILATLIIAAVFTPVRKGLEQVIDRRFRPPPSAGATEPAAASGVGLGAVAMDALVRRAVREELRAILEPGSGTPIAASSPAGPTSEATPQA